MVLFLCVGLVVVADLHIGDHVCDHVREGLDDLVDSFGRAGGEGQAFQLSDRVVHGVDGEVVEDGFQEMGFLENGLVVIGGGGGF